MHEAANNLTPSKEDYLKTLLLLSDNDGEGVRAIDIAAHIGVSKPSVSNMMNILTAEGFIARKKYGRIFLTEFGRDAAEYVKKNMMS